MTVEGFGQVSDGQTVSVREGYPLNFNCSSTVSGAVIILNTSPASIASEVDISGSNANRVYTLENVSRQIDPTTFTCDDSVGNVQFSIDVQCKNCEQ